MNFCVRTRLPYSSRYWNIFLIIINSDFAGLMMTWIDKLILDLGSRELPMNYLYPLSSVYNLKRFFKSFCCQCLDRRKSIHLKHTMLVIVILWYLTTWKHNGLLWFVQKELQKGALLVHRFQPDTYLLRSRYFPKNDCESILQQKSYRS